MSQPRRRRWPLARRWPGREPGHAERGTLSLMLIIVFPALVALAGIVIDGGAKLTAAENANSLAQEAARAGAGIINRQVAYSTGNFVVDANQAEAAAQEYLATAAIATPGISGTAEPGPDPNTIEVTVTILQPTKVLSIIGINSMTVTGQAIANLQTGVTGPGQ
jgi:hypothetical protein